MRNTLISLDLLYHSMRGGCGSDIHSQCHFPLDEFFPLRGSDEFACCVELTAD